MKNNTNYVILSAVEGSRNQRIINIPYSQMFRNIRRPLAKLRNFVATLNMTYKMHSALN